MADENPHTPANDLATTGGPTGGGTKRVRVRSALDHLSRQLMAADEVLETEWAANLLFAKSVRDSPNPEVSLRDRLRAIEFIDQMQARGIDVAEKVDKMERLDAGKLTENVGHMVKVVEGVNAGAMFGVKPVGN